MRSPKRLPTANRLTVLIAEDNPMDRRMLESMLAGQKSFPSHTRSVNSLKSAKHLLAHNRFDVVILDLNLADSKGKNTLVSLRRDFPNIPIVINTGSYEDDLGIKTLGIGAQDFLIKGKYNAYMLQRVLRFAVERKRLENELKKAYEELKETQSKLIQAEKMKVVGGLASGVAHEVKNPLATIMYGINYLVEKSDSKKSNDVKVLETIRQAADRANEIVNDLLDFAHVEKLSLKMTDFNLVVDKALLLVHHEFQRKKIRVVSKLDQGLSQICIDPNRVEQVVVNLLLNATHAVHANGKITLKSFRKKLGPRLSEIPAYSRNGFKPQQEVVFLTIADDGVGIPEKKLRTIFEPFSTTRRDEGGIGLGLSVSQAIMKNHHGAIFLKNLRKGGTQASLVFKV